MSSEKGATLPPGGGAGVRREGEGMKRHGWCPVGAFFCTLTLKPLSTNYSDKNKMVLKSKIYVIVHLSKPIGSTDTKSGPYCRLWTLGDNVVSMLLHQL